MELSLETFFQVLIENGETFMERIQGNKKYYFSIYYDVELNK